MRLIDADALLDRMKKAMERGSNLNGTFHLHIEHAPTITRQTWEWIPVKWHEITDEEREREGYPKDWVYYLDCEMPQDGQEILVQAKNGEIGWDVCYEDDGFSLDSGWDWKDDIIAWMPLPEPYEGGDED